MQIAEVVKRPKDELEIYLKKVRKEKKEKKIAKKQKKNKTENGEVPILTKSQKWAQKKKQKLMKKKSQQHDEFQSYKDHVKFGETVHAPPTLVAPRKAEKTSDSSRVSIQCITSIFSFILIFFFSLDKNNYFLKLYCRQIQQDRKKNLGIKTNPNFTKLTM